MNRIAVFAKLSHPSVKFGNDFCNGHFTRLHKAEAQITFGQGKYIYPIFEILN